MCVAGIAGRLKQKPPLLAAAATILGGVGWVVALWVWMAGTLAGVAIETGAGSVAVAATTNGLSLRWPESGARAYTVQTRSSLTEGGWVNAAWRYRWPAPFNHWTDSITTLRGPRFYRVVAEAMPVARRGVLLSKDAPRTLTTNQIKSVLSTAGSIGFVTVDRRITVTKITYETVDAYGLPILASGAVILPVDAIGPVPLVSVQHGATDLKNLVPSRSPAVRENEVYYAGVAFATRGYAVVMPDYIGLGDSPGFQALLHAKTEATAVVDGLRAARLLCASNHIVLSGRLFLFGFSQGGHATIAAHRELEALHSGEFTVTASVPCAGPYDGGHLAEEMIAPNESLAWRFVFPIQVAGYLPLYQIAPTLDELLDPPFSRNLPRLLNGTTDYSVISGAMPTGTDLTRMFRADFRADFRTNANNVLRRAMKENGVLDWTPQAPMRLLHCKGDVDVRFVHSERALEEFSKRGACCVGLVDPGAPAVFGHDMPCFNAGLRNALEWFAGFLP